MPKLCPKNSCHTVFRLQTFLFATNRQLVFSTAVVSPKAKRGRLACSAKDVNILDFTHAQNKFLNFPRACFCGCNGLAAATVAPV